MLFLNLMSKFFERSDGLRSRRSGRIPNHLAPPKPSLYPPLPTYHHILILSASLCSFVSCLMQKMNAGEQNELGSVDKAWFCISMLYVKDISTYK